MSEPSCSAGGESARIAAFHRYQTLDSSPEEACDRITRTVKTVPQMLMAVVSLVDRERQWFKSRQCVAATQTATSPARCAIAAT